MRPFYAAARRDQVLGLQWLDGRLCVGLTGGKEGLVLVIRRHTLDRS